MLSSLGFLQKLFWSNILKLKFPIRNFNFRICWVMGRSCEHILRACLEVWLWLLFKVFFTQKSMPIIFFYFLKIIFEISTLKWFENIKNILIQRKKKKIQIFSEALLKNTPKRPLNYGQNLSLSKSLKVCFFLDFKRENELISSNSTHNH